MVVPVVVNALVLVGGVGATDSVAVLGAVGVALVLMELLLFSF